MTDTVPEQPRSRLPLSQLVTLSIYWFGIQTIWGGLNITIIPGRLDDLSRDTQGTLLAIIMLAGAIAPIIIQPTVGVISDYTVTRWGRRKPYIVVGSLFDVVFLAGLAFNNDFVAMVGFYFLLQVSSNFAQGPFQGYVPDLVPAKQVGTASGLMGLMLTLGTIAGVGIATLGGIMDNVPAATLALGVVEVATMVVLVATVDEGRAAPKRTRPWREIALSAWGRDILQQRDVLWLLLVRLLFLGAYNATLIAIGYFRRSQGLSSDDADATVFLATAIVGVTTAAAAIPGGRLSDRFGRRPVIWAAALIAGTGLLGVAVAPTPELAIASWVPFGIGMGTFLSADWALMSDVIPKHTAGRYMGILNAGTAMAGPVFIIVAGPIQDLVSASFGDAAGPRVAMGVAALFVALSALALTRVDPRRREDEEMPAQRRWSRRERGRCHRARTAARAARRRHASLSDPVVAQPDSRAAPVRPAGHRPRAFAAGAVPAGCQPPQRLRPDAGDRGRAPRAADHLVRPEGGGLQPRLQEPGDGLLRRGDPVQPGQDHPDQRGACRASCLRCRRRARHLRRGAHRLP